MKMVVVNSSKTSVPSDTASYLKRIESLFLKYFSFHCWLRIHLYTNMLGLVLLYGIWVNNYSLTSNVRKQKLTQKEDYFAVRKP
jgi:hypothetical protein